MTVMSLDSLPLGFRFHPKDEELVNHYLRSKINGVNSVDAVIREVDICKHEPWDLPHLSVIKSDDKEWFFFASPVRKYPNSRRSNRATEAGFWKSTGRDQTINKASKSGMKSIGKRKTLVFHRGRAPHGKKTCWIIHEYRATEEELDGTKPGQSPFVLCHLFWMPDKKTKNSSSDESEQSGSSPTATKSLSKDTPVDQSLVQETPEVIENWLADNLDNMPPGPLVQGYITSDAEDRELEVPATEIGLQLEEELRRLIDEPLNFKPFSPLHTEMQIGEHPPFMNSPFTNDFGYGNNELMFHDGSNDQDPSITEFLSSVINDNHDEYSFEESTIEKTSVVESEAPVCTVIQQPQEEACPEISVGQSFLQGSVFQKDNGSSTDTDTEVEKKQYDPVMGDFWCINESTNMEDSIDLHMGRSQGAFYDGEYGIGNMGFPYTNSLEESISNGLLGTGIEIRPHQPQYESNCSIRGQGSAPRRIRLQREAICNWEDDESKPEVIEAGEISLETFTKLKLRGLRWHGVIEVKNMYIVRVALVIIFFMFFIGVWRCLTHEIVSFPKIY